MSLTPSQDNVKLTQISLGAKHTLEFISKKKNPHQKNLKNIMATERFWIYVKDSAKQPTAMGAVNITTLAGEGYMTSILNSLGFVTQGENENHNRDTILNGTSRLAVTFLAK